MKNLLMCKLIVYLSESRKTGNTNSERNNILFKSLESILILNTEILYVRQKVAFLVCFVIFNPSAVKG